jgi:hypothetical protein
MPYAMPGVPTPPFGGCARSGRPIVQGARKAEGLLETGELGVGYAVVTHRAFFMTVSDYGLQCRSSRTLCAGSMTERNHDSDPTTDRVHNAPHIVSSLCVYGRAPISENGRPIRRNTLQRSLREANIVAGVAIHPGGCEMRAEQLRLRSTALRASAAGTAARAEAVAAVRILRAAAARGTGHAQGGGDNR